MNKKMSKAWKKVATFFTDLFILNMNDFRNFAVYGNIESMKYEQLTQKAHYPLRIHPHSRFRIFWETFYIGYIIMNITFFYFFLTLSRYSKYIEVSPISKLLLIADLPVVANICFNFMTGFFVEGRVEAVMEFSKICIHSAKTTFFLDFIGLVFGSTLWDLINSEDDLQKYVVNISTGHKIWFVIRSAGILFRVFSSCYYWKYKISEYYLVNRLVGVIIEIFIFLPVIVSFLAVSVMVTNYGFLDSYIYIHDVPNALNAHVSLSLNIWTSSQEVPTSDSYSFVLVNILLIVYPYIRNITIVAFFIFIFWSNHASSASYNDLIDNLGSYLQSVNISTRLKVRIVKFYEEAYAGNFFDESFLLEGVSSEIRDDIILSKLAKIRDEIAVFKLIPTEELIIICSCLMVEMFFGNDIIALADAPSDRMYFIARGTVALYTNTATELIHIPVTNFFLWRGVADDLPPVVANYVACETTVTYGLSRNDYTQIVRPNCPVFTELFNFSYEFVIGVIEEIKEME